jgi:hypothetical protein
VQFYDCEKGLCDLYSLKVILGFLSCSSYHESLDLTYRGDVYYVFFHFFQDARLFFGNLDMSYEGI